MKSTLSEILEVEKNARLRINEAEEYRSRIVDDAKTQRDKIIAESIEAARGKVVVIREQLERRASEKSAALEERSESDLEKLEKRSAEKLEEWSRELYERTLSNN